ncbi:hypothetical protein V8F33_000952 [Rhypophila sp. PSN 637]
MFQNSRAGKEFVVEHEAPEGHSANPTDSGERRQPIYTTVGSVYNPDATTPLQPPTRRPRPRRYQPNLQSPIEASLILQTNLLAALPVQDTSPTSPTPGANRVPQYSQLQQNYDRAVSPLNIDEDNTAPSGVGMSVPSIRSGNLPHPTLGLGIAHQDKKDTADIKEDEESLTSGGFFPLHRFSTPSLTSLTKYPNPMQQAARDTLAKARSLSSSTGRVDSSTPVSQMASESGRRMDSSFRPPSTHTGAPQPLKAGPPGQRQFIPSTSDKAKAMKFLQEVQEAGQRFNPPKEAMVLLKGGAEAAKFIQELPPLQPPSYFGIALPEPKFTDLDTFSFFDRMKKAPTDDSDYINLAGLRSHLQTEFGSGISTSPQLPPLIFASVPCEDKPLKKIHDTRHYLDVREYYPDGPSPNFSGKFEGVPADWIKQYPLQGNGYPNDPESDEEKLARINARFYSGAQRYVKSLNQLHVDNDRRTVNKSIGVIGGERQRSQKRNDELVRSADGKIQRRHLSIEEANSMEDGAHAAPLLSMAYASLKEWKEAKPHDLRWGPQYSQPDPAYIDNSEGGNNSFFGEERPKLPKKKRFVTRKNRLGY